ncbi:MAG: preprotein translocase subunit SecG [Candidatus Sericytochromatia bacterium]
MKTLLVSVQFLSSILLILSVLLHPAKTMGMGSTEIFGSQKGAEDGLNRLTSIIATIWALTAIVLSAGFVE